MRISFWLAMTLLSGLGLDYGSRSTLIAADESFMATDPAPSDLVLLADDTLIVTLNQRSATATLLQSGDGKVLDEILIGQRPGSIASIPGSNRVLITARDSGTIGLYAVVDDQLRLIQSIKPGFEPHGIVVSPDGNRAFVSLSAAAAVAVVEIDPLRVTKQIETGRWPRHLALTPDGRRLAIAVGGEGGIAVVDADEGEMLFQEKFRGLNLGHLQTSADGKYVLFPRLFYGDNPTTPANIRRGWVLGSRVSRIGLREEGVANSLTLDEQGRAVGDPHGLAISSDQKWIVVTAGGTHELIILKQEGLPYIGIGGGEHVAPELKNDRERFFRLQLGGRPLGVRIAADSRTAYVANYLLGCVQEVDLIDRKLVRSMPLRDPTSNATNNANSLARRGEAIFFDAQRSLDGWYSCHSCHEEGGSNTVAMDTLNDGSTFTFKAVLPLYHVTRTAPWTWHGWQANLRDAMHKSLTSTMRGEAPGEDDVDALIAYLDTLVPPSNPNLRPDGTLSPVAQQGKLVFESKQAGCADCHQGPLFTDGEIHDVGLGREEDRYEGFNTPSLLGVYRKTRFLHHGYAKSLEELLTDYHSPQRVSGGEPLSFEQRAALIEYLQSL